MLVRGTSPPSLEINRVSTADQLANVLRNRILDGQMPPGSSLQEVALATSVGVSRNTVREAIRVLVHEGLVRHAAHRGATVSALSEEDVIDIYRVRRLLEIAAIEKGTAEPPDESALVPLRQALSKLEQALSAKDWPGIFEADMAFHSGIVSFLGCTRAVEFFTGVLAELRLGLILVDRATEEPGQLMAQHRQLFDLVAAGRTDAAVKVLRAHLAESEQMVRERVSTATAALAAHERP